ncbi:MAG TPA: exo-beta-N-acetylmuramidase NamZ domain-containing protein [Dissulfurispiraceae bacterium]
MAFLCILFESFAAPAVPAQIERREHPGGLREEQLAAIADVVEKEIRAGNTPGAVVLVGTPERVVYRRAFGYRELEPEKLPMETDTIFDLASLTKAVATTTAIMQLAERGKLRIDAPVCRYWPAFRTKGKKLIKVRDLLTHYSGLNPDLKLRPKWSGYKTAMRMILREKPFSKPGECYTYSDINFAVLGELVRRVSGQPLNVYCAKHIFKPLGMKDTGFKPAAKLRDRIAPTQYHEGKMLCGAVHDPICYRMGGVAGHAGLFSTADDLSIFAQTLLAGGSRNGVRILSARTVEEMTAPQSPEGGKTLRGLGWDIEPPLASNREEAFPAGSYAHLGYTGTSLWIDPVTRTYVIILTNRVHPDGKGDVKALRAQIKKIVSDANGPVSGEQVLARRPSLSGFYERMKTHTLHSMRGGKVLTGIDVLSSEDFSPLKGLRVGLITNHSGLDSEGRRTLDLIREAPGVKLAAIFSPEHGLLGNVDEKVRSTTEPATGLPVYSLYGDVRRPTDKMLKGLDALVFDIQDVGVRFYTYISTMGYAMEAAAKKGIAFYVLDRPNPINASLVQGPVMDRDLKSFTGYFPLPVRYGMTVGELAEMFNNENHIGAKLHVVKMQGYQRAEWFDETGLNWKDPSPNLRSLDEAILYPGIALVEGTNVSVGRGTDTPFELLGAPWINANEFAEYLNSRSIRGVQFAAIDFTPDGDIYKNRVCHGVRIVLEDRQALDSAVLGIEIVDALYRLYHRNFEVDKTLGLIGARNVLQAIKDGQDPGSVSSLWRPALERFLKLREKYLLY